MKIGEAMYKQTAPGADAGPQAGGPQAGGGGGAAGGGNDKVVDADFEEVDDKKRGSV
jgi:molecular chaperone DnaK